MKIRFKNPPINEVIVGAYFDQPIVQLRSEHVGLFWGQLRTAFPKTVQQPELSPPISAPGLTFRAGGDEPYPMPRFWLIAEDETTLIQIQKDAFIFNWRRRDADYPHYESVKASFDKYFAAYSTFLRDELGVGPLKFQITELAYNNLIEPGEYWRGADDTARVLPSFAIPNIGMSTVTNPDFNCLTAYKLAPDLTLNVSVRTGRKAAEAGTPVLVFEFRALGPVGAASKGDVDAWYDRAHDVISRCFTNITSPDIQRDYWQPV